MPKTYMGTSDELDSWRDEYEEAHKHDPSSGEKDDAYLRMRLLFTVAVSLNSIAASLCDLNINYCTNN